MYFTTRAFWADLAERVVSTAAAGAIAVVSASSFGLFTVDSWQDVAAAAGAAGLMSALKAFAMGRGGDTTAPAGPPTDTVPAIAGPAVSSAGGVTSTFPPAGA